MALKIPSGNLTQLLKITIFNGKIHYKWPFSSIFNSYVKLPEGNHNGWRYFGAGFGDACEDGPSEAGRQGHDGEAIS